jgi:aminopeptidase N
MARYTVRLEADAATCPVLLSNGNLLETGTCPVAATLPAGKTPSPSRPTCLPWWPPT